MRESNYSDMTHSAHADPIQSTTASLVEIPGKSAGMAPSGIQKQYSMIGKSIVIKGEIVAADPVYVYGCVEGSINAPQHRVTIGREGKVKADISAREVIVMGEVCGKLDADERVEIRGEGSLTGHLATRRICIEDGAFLSGDIVVSKPTETENAAAKEKPHLVLEPGENTSAA